jgi:hypothetical protein
MDGWLASEQVRKSQIFTTEARRHGEEREDWVIRKHGIVTGDFGMTMCVGIVCDASG